MEDRCECCSEANTENNCMGSEGIIYREDGTAYLYVEHFRNEGVRVDVNFCPMCGKDLRG